MTTELRADRDLGAVISKMQMSRMRPQSPRWLAAALAILLLLTAMAQAQVIPFQGNLGPSLSPDNNRLLFESAARLNGAVPSQVGRSEAWSNPQTKAMAPPPFSKCSTRVAWTGSALDLPISLRRATQVRR